MRGAAPDQGAKQQLPGDVGGGQVEDGDHVGLGQEGHEALDVLLELVASQVEVGQGVQAQLVGHQGLEEQFRIL